MYIDNSFSYPEKGLRLLDNGGSHRVVTGFSVTNKSAFLGYFDLGLYFNTTMVEYQSIYVSIVNSTLLIENVVWLFVGFDSSTNTVDYTINYRVGGMLTQIHHNFLGTIIFLSVYYNYILNIQNIVSLDENLNVLYNDTTSTNSIYWYNGMYASQSIVSVYSDNFGYCDVILLGLDYSSNLGYYRYRSFNYTILDKYGYYSTSTYNIPLTNVLSNVLNPQVLCGNITFSLYSGIRKQYNWIDIIYNRLDYFLNGFYSIIQTNKTVLLIICNYYDDNDKSEQIIKIQVNLTLTYDYNNDLLFNIYLKALIPLSILFLIPYFTYYVSRKRNSIFWLSLFIIDLSLIIYYNLIANFGAILSIGSFFMLLFMSFKDEN